MSGVYQTCWKAPTIQQNVDEWMYWALVKTGPLRKEASCWSPPTLIAHGTKEEMISSKADCQGSSKHSSPGPSHITPQAFGSSSEEMGMRRDRRLSHYCCSHQFLMRIYFVPQIDFGRLKSSQTEPRIWSQFADLISELHNIGIYEPSI